MAVTEFSVNHDLAIKRWSQLLAVDAPKESYFFRNGFVGESTDSPIVRITDLEKNKGDKVTYGLRMKLTGAGREGDQQLEGYEEALSYYDDALFIDQIRHAVRSKGKASEQRVPYEMREEARAGLATWFGEWYDEQLFVYLTGLRGLQGNLNLPLSFNGRAGNDLQTPSATRRVYGGDATAFTDIDSTDELATSTLDKVIVKAMTLTAPRFRKMRYEGKDGLVSLWHPFQIYTLQRDAGADGWLEIQKMAGERGNKNPLMTGALGVYKGMILHQHENVIRFDTAGAAGNVEGACGLVLGAQAGVIAWGAGQQGSGRRFSWQEELYDYGNQLGVSAGTVCGIKKTVFNSPDGNTTVDYGVLRVDTACIDPNAA